MTKIKIYSCIVLTLFLYSCTSIQLHKSLWYKEVQNFPATIFQKENNITLTVSNNETDLFIELFSNSPETIANIKATGLSLWLNKGKNPQKKYGIHYPLPYTDTKDKVALENFSQANLVAIPLSEIAPIQLSATLSTEEMHYNLQIPLTELNLKNTDIFTVQLSSFASGETEYLSSLTTSEEIERRLNEYKAKRDRNYNQNEIIPFFFTFELAKMPNKTR